MPGTPQVPVEHAPIRTSEFLPVNPLQTEQPTEGDKRPLSKGLIFEIFSGTGRLSFACRQLGLRALPIDKDPKRAEKTISVNFDVTNPDQLQRLLELVHAEKDNIIHAHFAPSCGTSSQARNIKIPNVPLDQQPRPLRSQEYPDGLPGLTPGDQARVNKANAAYEATAKLVEVFLQLGVSISIENPANSLFWKTSWIKNMLNKHAGHHTSFHNCMHGGDRDKLSTFWSLNPRVPNINLLESLKLLCDKSHAHKGWRPRHIDGKLTFPTKEEAAYPQLLCSRLASLFVDEAVQRGFVPFSNLEEQASAEIHVGKRHLFASQTRTQKIKQPVSEFGKTVAFAVPIQPSADEDHLKNFPKGSKILTRQVQSGFFGDVFVKKFKHAKIHEGLKDGDHFFEIIHVGIPRTPEEFLCESLKVGHPKNLLKRIGIDLKKAVENINESNHANIVADRARFFKKWLARAKELQDAENKLHTDMPCHLRQILRGKRLLLWKEILVDLEYPDAAIIDEAIQGFKLTGWTVPTGVFQPDVRAPGHSVDQLKGMARGLNSAVVGSLRSAEWNQLDEQALRETEEEVAKGWLRPSSNVNLDESFVAKRFPLEQKDKIRLIDDFTVCGVNGTFGLCEKLRVETIDEMVACLLIALDVDDGGSSKTPCQLVGRCFDLKSAYKQFGVDSHHVDLLKIVLKSAPGEVNFYDVLALPFGATGSVAAFLRLAASIAYIGVKGLHLVWTVFFDDFTCVTPQTLLKNTTTCVESLFRILGMVFAEEGPKAPPFDVSFKTLGLQVDLQGWAEGSFSLQHTSARKAELSETMQTLLAKGVTSPKDIERLHGRLVWFNAYIFGRKINRAVRTLSSLSRSHNSSIKVEGQLREALIFLREEVESVEPLRIERCLSNTWIVFTDGAFEPSSSNPATIGGVLVSPHGSVVSYFGEALPPELTKHFVEKSKHPIYELELLPVLISLVLWGPMMKSSHAVCYLDNDAARSSLIRASGATDLGTWLIDLTVQFEIENKLVPWFARVPSISNPADEVSRLEFTGDLFVKAQRLRVDLPRHFEEWGIHGCSGSTDHSCTS